VQRRLAAILSADARLQPSDGDDEMARSHAIDMSQSRSDSLFSHGRVSITREHTREFGSAVDAVKRAAMQSQLGAECRVAETAAWLSASASISAT